MPEKIEEILRAIHILFSKGEMYHELQDKVILSKREMFDLLERLNYAVVEVMDQYEATTRAKEKAMRDLEEEGKKIVAAANREAEDVYAASILYTDGALNEFTNIVGETRQRFRDEYAYFEETMNQQLEQIRQNQEELLERLQLLSQNKKYLDIINDYNTEEAADESEEEVEKANSNPQGKGNKKNEIPSEAVIPEKFIKKTRNSSLPQGNQEEEEWEDDIPARQKIEVKVHNGSGLPENSIFNDNVLKSKKDRKREEKNEKQKKDDDRIPSLSEKLKLMEEDEIPIVSTEELDAEYELWQSENAQEEPVQEKGKPGFFERFIGKR